MMKASFRLIFAALAATAALVSCTKEPTPGQTDQTPASPAAEGTRVIAVSFAPQTKTSFTSTEDGIQPKFDNKDSILLVTDPDDPMAEVDTQTVAVSVDPKTEEATITTTLSGKLKALYPARMAIEGKGGFNIFVPAEQSGKFADANICSATIEENATSVQFENKYALFIITPPEGTKSLTIKSLKGIDENGQRSGTQFTISNANTLDGEGCTITIPNEPLDKDGKYYVAVCGNARLSDLSFEAWSNNDGTTGSIKGIPTSRIEYQAKQKKESYADYNPVAIGTAYSIDDSNWHEYITIAGRKWAVENVGEGSETGDFYMWGTSVVAYVEHPSKQDDLVVIVDENPYGEIYQNEWKQTDGYCWNNTPFTNGVFQNGNTVFVKYTASVDTIAFTGSADGKTILDLEDDAAYVNWGGAWRIPTISELQNAPSDKLTLNGVINEPNGGEKYEVYNVGGAGYYWSSSLDEEHPNQAQCIKVEGGGSSIESQPRFWGCSIRAIIDDISGSITPLEGSSDITSSFED